MDSQADFSKKLNTELENILNYWQSNAIDEEFGGFHGRIDHHNKVVKKSPKSIILNTRILWTFARASNFYGDRRFEFECERAFNYLYTHFRDKNHRGVFWEVNHVGTPTDTRKQVYAQAFCIYALSEYYKYSKNPKALVWAKQLFQLLENKAFDKKLGGYFEAFDEAWAPIEDMRLSTKDLNAPKTTNTHLHILEAYTTLLEVTADTVVEKSLERLLDLFTSKIFRYNNHLKLFFTIDWKNISPEISYGHDIEAAWLLLKAAEVLEDNSIIKLCETLMQDVAKTFVNEALDKDFGVINAKDSQTEHIDTDKHWWPQAEAIVGLIYTWKITENRSYYTISQQIWNFIEECIIDHENGEWFFRVNAAGLPYTEENKLGPWKCPYHNGRALIEVLSKLRS